MSPRILMIDSDASGARIRAYVLQASGYDVTVATDPDKAKTILLEQPNAVVCSVRMQDRDGLPLLEHMRRIAPKVPLVGMLDTPYSNTPEEMADRFVLKLDGPKALLGALGEVLAFRHHTHPEFEGEHVVFVDHERRYIDATEKASQLIGYQRHELLGKRIEDVSVPGGEETKRQFSQYLADGAQSGVFELRHKAGHVVTIRYRARVLPDGCMVAEWEPLEQAANTSKAAKT